uniref:Uncharacterized protein n=1 Tax=Oryza sativa subsp. japonica TaxID=39947 RepID=Q75HR3_ORYSJ|nr:hypothetical protein [Oryza sativa Japonica Group]AAV25012.1 hypothetical protein [Oryza sativa Japonica Group]
MASPRDASSLLLAGLLAGAYQNYNDFRSNAVDSRFLSHMLSRYTVITGSSNRDSPQ